MNDQTTRVPPDSVSPPRVLVVSRNPTIESTLEFLDRNSLNVQLVPDGDQAAIRLKEGVIDALLLDIRLNDCDVFELCRQLRHQFAGTIVVLSDQYDEREEVEAFEYGADDYFSNLDHQPALMARLQKRLSQATRTLHSTSEDQVAAGVIDVNGLCICASSRTVQFDNQPIDLSTTEFDLLWLLACRAGRVLARQWIYEQLHGIPYHPTYRSVDLCVSRIRKKFADDSVNPRLIKSVRGVGYMLATESGDQTKSIFSLKQI